MKNIISALGAALLFLFVYIGSASADGRYEGTIYVDGTPCYAQAYAVDYYTSLSYGAKVSVFPNNVDGAWQLVQLGPEGATCWVEGYVLEPPHDAVIDTDESAPTNTAPVEVVEEKEVVAVAPEPVIEDPVVYEEPAQPITAPVVTELPSTGSGTAKIILSNIVFWGTVPVGLFVAACIARRKQANREKAMPVISR